MNGTLCHSRVGGNPRAARSATKTSPVLSVFNDLRMCPVWIPAFAGETEIWLLAVGAH